MARARKSHILRPTNATPTADVALRPTSYQFNNEPVKMEWMNPGKDCWGYYCREDRTVRIQPRVGPAMSLEIALHEMSHNIISEDLSLRARFKGREGSKLEEEVVDAIGRNLTQILIRNPRVLAWVNEVARVARESELR